MKQVINRYKAWILLFAVMLLIIVMWMMYAHQREAEMLREEVYKNFQNEVSTQVNLLIEEQKNASLALALMLSENPTIKTLLKSECCEYQANLKQVAQRIERESNLTSIWLQAVNHQGISLERSWVDRKGDSLIGIRADLEALLANPNQAPNTTVSTGIFTMSFKTMVPVFEDETLLGVVEVISQFQPLINRFGLESFQSLVLADRRHRSKIILPRSKLFIDDYYVVNTLPVDELVEVVKQIGVEKVVEAGSYHIYQDSLFITHVPILDAEGNVEGYWLAAKPVSSLNFKQVDVLLGRYFLVSSVVIVMLVLLGIIFLSRQQVVLQSNYYQNIIDSASDILYVSDLDHIVFANGHFFALFDEFETIEAFHQKYSCVCDTFEPGEGLLQREINGVYWLQHIMNNPGMTHKAKIIRHNKAYFFAIKVQALTESLFGRFTIAMHDITELEKVQSQLAHLSQTDELTGIGNRLFFNKNLHHELARTKRYKVPMCFLMFDVDHFKAINDQYGHDVGDSVLVELAQIVADALRETDLFCRYGGEEFVVMLPETEMREAQQVAERLLNTVATHSFSAMPGQQLTCSFGLTCAKAEDTENSVLKRVDQALYQAKHNGRNQVIVS